MNLLTTDLIEALAQKQDMTEVFRHHLDATHIPIRRQTVEKEAVYIAIGITEEGTKEVLNFIIAPTESAHVWDELLQHLQGRGMETALLFIPDGLPGMTDAIQMKKYYHHPIRRKLKLMLKIHPNGLCSI